MSFLENLVLKQTINLRYFYLKTTANLAVKRLVTRRTCKACRYDFILVKNVLKGVCDFCQGELLTRSTDTKEKILKRINFFYETTYKFIEHIGNERLTIINAGKDLDELSREFFSLL